MAEEKYKSYLAWDSSLKILDWVVPLSSSALEEICEAVQTVGGKLVEDDDFNDLIQDRKGNVLRAEKIIPSNKLPNLEREVMQKMIYLENPGFVIFDGIASFEKIPKERWLSAYRLISQFVGEMIPQDRYEVEVKTVRNRGHQLHYSDGNQGGGLHTDGAERPLPVPDLFGFMYVNPAMRGGESLLISVYSICNALMEKNPRFLETLQEKFYFDTREKGVPPFEKPVLFNDSGNVGITYLRKYIDEGHKLAKIPLSELQRRSLDCLDKIIEPHDDNPLISREYLQPGQVVFFENTKLIHGRTGFEDWPKGSSMPPRKLYRSWLRRKNN